MIIKTDDGKIKITLPLTDDDIKELHAGDSVLISGSLITCLLYTSPSPRD